MHLAYCRGANTIWLQCTLHLSMRVLWCAYLKLQLRYPLDWTGASSLGCSHVLKGFEWGSAGIPQGHCSSCYRDKRMWTQRWVLYEEKSGNESRLAAKRQQIPKEMFFFLEFFWDNVTSRPNKLTRLVTKVTHTEAHIVSIDRVLNFFSVESRFFKSTSCFFFFFFFPPTDGLLKVKI